MYSEIIKNSEDMLAPIEVKAEWNLRSKSLRQFYINNQDVVQVRISLSDYRKEEGLTNIPLYTAERIKEVVAAHI